MALDDHAPLPPSSADRGVICPAGWTMSAKYPQPDTEETLEGTAAHWAASELASGCVIKVGERAPNGVTLTEEMLEHASDYADLILEIGHGWPSLETWIEQRIDILAVHSQNWGTPDFRGSWWDSSRIFHIHIADFKYGHRSVPADTWQLVNYMVGAVHIALVAGVDPAQIQCHMSIYQPRDFHARDGGWRTRTMTLFDLLPLAEKLGTAAEDAMSATPTYRPTVEGCRDCPGRHECEANLRAVWDSPVGSKGWLPLNLEPRALGREIRALQDAQAMLDARLNGLVAAAEQQLRQGTLGLGFVLESEPGRAVWTKPASTVIAMGKLLGVDLAKKPDAVTPKQAEKLIDGSMIKAYSTRFPGKPKLTRIENTLAISAFKKD